MSLGISKILSSHGIRIAYTPGNSLQSLLGNTKDKIDEHERSGIYEINCSGCDKKYIGQTKRPIVTRFKEHIAHFRFNRPEKSAVAQHILETSHPIELKNLKLIRTVTNNRELNAYESLYIKKYKQVLLNTDYGPIPNSVLLDLLQYRS